MNRLILLAAVILLLAPNARCQTPVPIPVTAPSINGVLNVLEYGGTGTVDLGTRINAADTALGSACGTLEVPPGQTGLTIAVAPILSTCHTLWLRSPVTWSATATPTLASTTAILGDGPTALQTLPAGAWISASNLQQVAIENLWVTNPNRRNKANLVLHCQTCTDVSFRKNHMFAEGGILMDSTASASGYSAVNSSNVSSRVNISDNYLDGNGDAVDLALLQYTQHVFETNNKTYNAQYGTQWWGGDANANGAVTNTRWAQDISISNSLDVNVRAGEWGSMGQEVTVTGAVADGCSDVCLDTEGGYRISFSNFTVHNGVNGGLGTFFASQHVNFGPGVVTDDTSAGSLLFYLHNASLDPTKSYDVTIHDILFNCGDPATTCHGFMDPIGGVRILNNSFRNGDITATRTHNSGFHIVGNRFLYTSTIALGFEAINLKGVFGSYATLAEVSRNSFASSVAQGSGTCAIKVVDGDPNYNDTVVVSGNTTQGFTTDAILTAASANSSITPTFVYFGNVFGGNSLQKITTGAHGAFLKRSTTPGR